jgi:hypothetical protein
MRWSARLKVGNLTLFGMASHTQTLGGITNRWIGSQATSEDDFFLVWDLEKFTDDDCTFENVRKELEYIQALYRLPDVFITTDKPESSWHAFSFPHFTFRKYLVVLNDTKYVDWNFIYWTVSRGEATIRVTDKQGRPQQHVIDCIHGSVDYEIPEKFQGIVYDTGLEKRGRVLKVTV